MKTITNDSGELETVCRAYKVPSGKLLVCRNRRIYLDCGGDRVSDCGKLPSDAKITKEYVRRFANH